jgi:hypothetical protein
MIVDVVFKESNDTFDTEFGEVFNISDGGYEKGYAEGYEKGNADGYEQGEKASFDIGKQAEWSEFWDLYQQNGNRTDYAHAFRGAGWNDTTFKPKHNIVCGEWDNYIFTTCNITDLKGILEECGVTLDTSKVSGGTQLFASSRVTKVPPIDCSAMTTCLAMFNACVCLTDVELNNVRDVLTGNNMFGNCTELVNFKGTGTIGANGWRFNNSNKLSHESLLNILNMLKDYSADTSGTSWVMTLGATNLDKLTDAEKLIATNKGWTLA